MTTSNPAPLLAGDVIAQIRRIASAVRSGELATLVGAGFSVPRGIPAWADLVDRLILAWQRWDRSESARRLSPDNYRRLVRQTFQDNLAIISYLRHRVAQDGGPLSFGQLLYAALYTPFLEIGDLATPEPSHLHRHLVALANQAPRRIWTTNYDDLFEEAARLAGIPARTLDPARRTVGRDLAVAHLHGFLAPPDRQAEHPDPTQATVILAEDDYHGVATDVIGWTNREFYRLFDEHRVLILGMSLADPNLRRVLATLPRRDQTGDARHFAVMRSLDGASLGLKRIRRAAVARGVNDANRFRASLWYQREVEVVALPDHASSLPFLVRLRYESFGQGPGELWREGGRVGHAAVDPWRPDRQQTATHFLNGAVAALVREFSVADKSEIVEIGIFLLKPDGKTLELTFRSGPVSRAQPGQRTFSADPDRPTGVAGRVLVSGDLVRVPRSHPLHDFGVETSTAMSTSAYEGIISVPLFDWTRDGVPLGVIYVTTSKIDGTLFSLHPRSATTATDPTLDDLYTWLADLATTLISSWT